MRCGRELMVENKFRTDSIVSSEYVNGYVPYVASASGFGTFQERAEWSEQLSLECFPSYSSS